MKALELGRITVNGNPVKADYKLSKTSNQICHRTHRHELPVLDKPFAIIFENEDVLVIDKPPSIPIHPCGRYNKNSVTHILKNEYGKDPIFVIHRLDSLTSGVVMFGKSSKIAQELSQEMINKEISKIYLAKVIGKFPDGVTTIDKAIAVLDFKQGTRKIDDKDDQRKESVTKCYLIDYDKETDTSIIFSRPITGRTHQIRLHVESLGHPITNDPVYGPKRKELEAKGIKVNDNEIIFENTDEDQQKKKRRPNSEDADELCDECKKIQPDISPCDLILYLHAWRYKTSKWDFYSTIPDWCGIPLEQIQEKFGEFNAKLEAKLE